MTETGFVSERSNGPSLTRAWSRGQLSAPWRNDQATADRARGKALDADLVRVIHGFDSLLVLSGSNPSQNL